MSDIVKIESLPELEAKLHQIKVLMMFFEQDPDKIAEKVRKIVERY